MNAPLSPSRTRGFEALLTAAQWRDLLASGSRMQLSAQTRLLDQGDRRAVVYALHRGRVRVVSTSPDGDEALIAIRGPGDLIGEYSQQDQGGHMATVWGLEDGEASVLTSAAFAAFLRRHALDETLHRYILSKTRQGAQRILRLAHLQTEQRLAQLFLEIVNADPTAGEAVIPMSQALIASSLGVTRRRVNLLLSRWRERGLVRTQPSPITVLDLAALSRRANLR